MNRFKTNNIRRIGRVIFFLVAVVCFFQTNTINIVHATACTTTSEDGTTKYCLLAPIPGLSSSTDNSIDVKEDFGGYVTRMIRIIIGLMAVIAVIMVIFGGIQYMISESGGEKGAGKERIMNAIWGLVLALSSYMILNTINPDLVDIGINIPHGELTLFNNTKQGQDGNEKIGTTAPPGVKGNVLVLPKSTDDEYPDGLRLVASDVSSLDLTTISKSSLDFWTGTIFDSSAQSSIKVSSYIQKRLKKSFSDWKTKVSTAQGLAAGVRSGSQNEDATYLIKYMSGYAPTEVEGNNSFLSSHAFGVSIDIQPVPLPSDLRIIFQNDGFSVSETEDSKSHEKYAHITRLNDDGGMTGSSFSIPSHFNYEGE